MNFTDFTKDLSEEFGFSERQSRKIITFLTKRLKNKLVFGCEVSLREIGIFKLRIRKPRPFLHLKTGKTEMSKKSFYLSFRPSKKMADQLKDKTVY